MKDWNTSALLAALLIPATALAHSSEEGAPVSGLGILRAEVDVHDHGTPPAGFLPRPDGSVVLLDDAAKGLRIARGAEVSAARPLRGRGFDPEVAHLIDLAPGDEGNLLVLDAGARTLWVVRPSGRIEARLGLFQAPTAVGRGADGRIYVADAAAGGVKVFDGTKMVGVRRSAGRTFPFATARGGVPSVEVASNREAVRVRTQGPEGSVDLGAVEPRVGRQVMDARVVGAQRDEVLVEVLSYDPGDSAPRDTSLWSLRPGVEPRRLQAETVNNMCWDCGPDYRVGPGGAPWTYALGGGSYRVFELVRAGGAR